MYLCESCIAIFARTVSWNYTSSPFKWFSYTYSKPFFFQGYDCSSKKSFFFKKETLINDRLKNIYWKYQELLDTKQRFSYFDGSAILYYKVFYSYCWKIYSKSSQRLFALKYFSLKGMLAKNKKVNPYYWIINNEKNGN